MADEVSIAIETSCPAGGIALGKGERIVQTVNFDASGRHTTQLISRMQEMFEAASLRPTDLEHAYVSVGPGSFTGVRVGVTVARTLGQMIDNLRCVGVPTGRAVAQNAADLEWEHLGVILPAKGEQVYVGLFARRDGEIVPDGPGKVVAIGEFLSAAPRPILLIGEALEFHRLEGEGITTGDPRIYLPTAEGVWKVGRAMAGEGQFTDYQRLLPVYARGVEAVRLWEKRRKKS